MKPEAESKSKLEAKRKVKESNQDSKVIPSAGDAAAEGELDADGVRDEERGKCWNPQE